MSEYPQETTRLFALLRNLSNGRKVEPEEIHEATNEVYNMAASNIVERVFSKLDALTESNNAKWDAFTESNNVRMDSLDSKYTSIRWLIGVGLTLIGIGLTLIGIIVAYGTFIAG